MDFMKIAFTALLSAGTLFIIAKIMGHKQMAQLDFFDYITGITIGSIAAELATELESPEKPLIAMIIYGLISVLLSKIATKSLRIRKFINGTPTIIMADGKICRENMKKAKLELSEFMVLCRQEGYFNLDEIQTAVFEHNGRLTILPTSESRPLSPKDLKLAPEKAEIFTEIIMDGRILENNLKRRGLNLTWLNKEIEKLGYQKADEIYLALCGSDNQLRIYGENKKE